MAQPGPTSARRPLNRRIRRSRRQRPLAPDGGAPAASNGERESWRRNGRRRQRSEESKLPGLSQCSPDCVGIILLDSSSKSTSPWQSLMPRLRIWLTRQSTPLSPIHPHVRTHKVASLTGRSDLQERSGWRIVRSLGGRVGAGGGSGPVGLYGAGPEKSPGGWPVFGLPGRARFRPVGIQAGSTQPNRTGLWSDEAVGSASSTRVSYKTGRADESGPGLLDGRQREEGREAAEKRRSVGRGDRRSFSRHLLPSLIGCPQIACACDGLGGFVSPFSLGLPFFPLSVFLFSISLCLCRLFAVPLDRKRRLPDFAFWGSVRCAICRSRFRVFRSSLPCRGLCCFFLMMNLFTVNNFCFRSTLGRYFRLLGWLVRSLTCSLPLGCIRFCNYGEDESSVRSPFSVVTVFDVSRCNLNLG